MAVVQVGADAEFTAVMELLADIFAVFPAHLTFFVYHNAGYRLAPAGWSDNGFPVVDRKSHGG